MTTPPELAATREYHEQLFAGNQDGMLGYAACVTVLPGGRDVDEVCERLGTVVRRQERITDEEFDEADSEVVAGGRLAMVRVARIGDAVVLVEQAGYAGSLPEVLGPLSHGGHRVANARFTRTYPSASVGFAEDTRVEHRSLTRSGPPTEVPTLAPLLAQVDPDDDDSHPVWAFTIVEVLTGVRLDRSVFEGSWPAVWFAPWEPNPARPPGVLGDRDAGLALALQTASLPDYLDACRRLGAGVAAAVGEADDPAVRAFLDSTAAGRRPDREALAATAAAWADDHELPDDDWPDPADPVWRRFMAGRVLVALARDIEKAADDPRTPSSWVEAHWVLGEDWDGFRDDVVATLRRADAGS